MKHKQSLLRLMLFSFVLFLLSPLAAANLAMLPVTLSQPDGSVLECFVSGDEYYHYLHDKDQYTIIQSPENGFYSYAMRDGSSILASSLIPGRDDPFAAGINPFIKISESDYRLRRQTLFQDPDPSRTPTIGTINNLVIFIRFSNQTEFSQNISTYNSWFNSGTNSLKNYFLETSYNQLTVDTSMYPPAQNNLVVSWQSANPRGYYSPYNASTNAIGYTSLDQGYTRLLDLLESASNGVAAHIPPALNIDADNDGRVDNVVFITRGGADTWSDVLWPHRWSINDRFVYINGKRVYDYNFQLQDFLVSDNVGILCHEFFHTLGAPDLYHYNFDGISPVGSWDIMETNTNPPQHMGAYMKWKYGNWIPTIPTISSSQVYSLNPLTSATGSVYRINSTSPNEYYIVEFRKKTGTYENSIPASGMLIYRINPSLNGNAQGPPDEVYIYRPGGTPNSNGTINNAFYSSESGRTAINQNTNPSPFLSNGTNGGLDISGIGSSAGNSISFTLGESTALPEPTNVNVSAVGNTVNMSWTAPGSGSVDTWLTWDNGTLGNSVGTNAAANFDVAHRFTQTDLTDLQGASITQIRFVPSFQNCTYTIKVWTGGTSATNPGTLAASQTVNNFVLDEWNSVNLTTPVSIPSTGELWFGYNVNTTGGYPAGCDSGPAIDGLGNVMYFSNAWTTLLSLAPSLNYNWLLGAYAQNSRGTRELLSKSPDLLLDTTSSYVNEPAPLSMFHNSALYQRYMDRALWGFKIYRNGSLISTINDPATTTYTDIGVANGTYTYGVSALHSGGESNQVSVQVTVSGSGAPAYWQSGFENHPNFALEFAPWTLIDVDQSGTYGFEGISFTNSGSPMAFIIFNPSATTPPLTTMTPHGGAKTAACFASTVPANNDWLISPQTALGTQSSFSFWARSQTAEWGLERMRVGISTSDVPNPSSFVYLTGTSYVQVPITWTEYVYDLSAYNGQNVWLGIQCVSNDAFVLYVDDFSIFGVGGYLDNEDSSIPALQTSLLGNYPNPFNPQSTIRYSIKDPEDVKIGIYNQRGQLVKHLIDAKHNAGVYSVVWDGKDTRGSSVSSGIYFYRLSAGKYQSQRKMILLK